jgi:hypothetical protein
VEIYGTGASRFVLIITLEVYLAHTHTHMRLFPEVACQMSNDMAQASESLQPDIVHANEAPENGTAVEQTSLLSNALELFYSFKGQEGSAVIEPEHFQRGLEESAVGGTKLGDALLEENELESNEPLSLGLLVLDSLDGLQPKTGYFHNSISLSLSL